MLEFQEPEPVGAVFSLPVRIGNRGGHKQPLRVGVFGCPGDLSAVAPFNDLAVVYHGNPVAEVPHHGEIVGDKEVGDAGAFLDLDEQIHNAGLGGEVQAETGSSQTISFGSRARARAMATRWRWPPENSRGNRCAAPCGSRTWSRRSATRLLAAWRSTLRTVSGSVRICSMVMDGFSDVYGSWNTTWISWLSSLRWARVAWEISLPRYLILPPVTRARPSGQSIPASLSNQCINPGGCCRKHPEQQF